MKLSAILLAASICMMPSVGTQAKSKKKDKKNAPAAMQQSPAAGSYASSQAEARSRPDSSPCCTTPRPDS